MNELAYKHGYCINVELHDNIEIKTPKSCIGKYVPEHVFNIQYKESNDTITCQIDDTEPAHFPSQKFAKPTIILTLVACLEQVFRAPIKFEPNDFIQKLKDSLSMTQEDRMDEATFILLLESPPDQQKEILELDGFEKFRDSFATINKIKSNI